MAVPTFTSITPATGTPAGRTFATVVGTNFRLPPAPAPGPSLPYRSTVRVQFGTEAAIRVDVVSETTLYVVVPSYRGASDADPIPAVSVAVTNLDDLGVAIPGETVTSAAAFTYARLGLRAPAVEQAPIAVVREISRVLKRSVHVNTNFSTHTDFGLAGTTGTLLAQLPALIVGSFTIEDEDSVRSRKNDFRGVVVAGLRERRWPALTLRLNYQVTGVSDNFLEVEQLAFSLIDTVERMPYLIVESGTAFGRVSYPWEFASLPVFGLPVSTGNLKTFVAELRVLDVAVELSDAYEREAAITVIQSTLNQVGTILTETVSF